MNLNQKINCTVGSCKYNNQKNQICELQQIVVTPSNNCKTKKPDESMCSSYEYDIKYLAIKVLRFFIFLGDLKLLNKIKEVKET